MSATKHNVNAEDAELWHSYLRAISDYFPFTGNSSSQRIYTAPLTSFGVTIGEAVDPAIINRDIFRLGDLLLPTDSPVFLPRLSYSKRLRRYLQAVVTPPGQQDSSTLARLEEATQKLGDASRAFTQCRRQAYAEYLSDPAYFPTGDQSSAAMEATLSFDSWVKMFYPDYQLASLRKDALSQEAHEAHMNYFGSNTASLWRDKNQLDRAFEALTPNLPYNMPTSTAQVTREAVFGTGASRPASNIVHQPRYNIDGRFSFQTLNWILNADDGKNKPLEITFDSRFPPGCNCPDWDDIGFTNTPFQNHDEVLDRVPLFTARTRETSTPLGAPDYHVGLDGEHTSVIVTIRASDAAVFSIGPDQSWDIPDITTTYPTLRKDAPADLFQPLVLVTHVLLGYKVSISMRLDEHTFSRIDAGIRKCQHAGGTASLFGLSCGPRSTASTVGFEQIGRDPVTNTINIPPRDDSQLTLMGLMGMKLNAPVSASYPRATPN